MAASDAPSALVAGLTSNVVALLLIETASRDLSRIDGAFGRTAAEWTVICFGAGVAIAIVGNLLALFGKPSR